MTRAKFRCPSNLPCFARDRCGLCTALLKRPKNLCTFRKPAGEWTKGKYYPYINPQDPTADLRVKGVKR